MSQEKLGDALGLTFQQVQKYEKGTNRIGASRLQQISQILQAPVSFFFDGAPLQAMHSKDDLCEPPSPAYVADFLASADGQVVDLVEEIVADQK
jgi:transcriptional regulator with XRE-family HTH domain